MNDTRPKIRIYSDLNIELTSLLRYYPCAKTRYPILKDFIGRVSVKRGDAMAAHGINI